MAIGRWLQGASVAALFAWGWGVPALGADGPRVVATTGMIADVAREVAGDRAEVAGLMGPGVDPHLYKVSPSDVRAMGDADLILYNGLHLEGRMADVIVRMASRRKVVQVTESIDESLLREPAEFDGHYDPHVWFDVSLWGVVAERVRDALIEVDGAGAEFYRSRGDAYAELLRELDAYVRRAVETIPGEWRVLVTAHDAFGYFGRAYGIEVRGIQGISTDSEASLRDINSMVDELVERKIPAVFVESSVPRKTIDALVEGCRSRGHTIVVGGELFSDALGDAGTPSGTYIGMVLHNVHAIVRGLGGKVPDGLPPGLAAYMEGATR